MIFKFKRRLVQHLSHDGYAPSTGERLAEDLGVDAEDAASFGEELEHLVKAGELERDSAGRVQLRRVPEITFHLDERAEKAARIDTLLRKIHEGEGAAAASASSAPDDEEDDEGIDDEDDEDVEFDDEDDEEFDDEDDDEDEGDDDERA